MIAVLGMVMLKEPIGGDFKDTSKSGPKYHKTVQHHTTVIRGKLGRG